MQTQGTYRLGMLILGVTAALASCLLALTLAAPSVQAATQRGDLSISQTDGPDPLESGHLIYGLTVKHELVDGCGPGCYRSGPISLSDTLPASVTLVDVVYPTTTPSSNYDVSCSSGTGTVTCNIGTLSDGEAVDIDIVVKPNSAGAQTLTNTATVSSADSYWSSTYPDPDTTNNTSTATTQVSESYTPSSGSYTRPPNTTLTNTPDAFSDAASPRFSFASNDANATFECKLDNAAFGSCGSPKQLFLLSEGQHTFQVRAKDASSNVDPTPARHTWTVDSISPKIDFTEQPSRVTNDRTPTWAWTVEETNPGGSYNSCSVYDDTNNRDIFSQYDCSSPLNFEADLPDGNYNFEIELNDKAGNWAYEYLDFEVDTVAPKFVSGKPTGSRVSQWADPTVTFDDNVYGSARFVNIYKKGSSTPLALSREYAYEDGAKYIDISPKNYLKRDTWYTVKVTTEVNDGANNLEAPKTWNFKTK